MNRIAPVSEVVVEINEMTLLHEFKDLLKEQQKFVKILFYHIYILLAIISLLIACIVCFLWYFYFS